MVFGAFGKLGWGIAILVLYAQGRISPGDMALGAVDLLLGALFLLAFFKTPSQQTA